MEKNYRSCNVRDSFSPIREARLAMPFCLTRCGCWQNNSRPRLFLLLPFYRPPAAKVEFLPLSRNLHPLLCLSAHRPVSYRLSCHQNRLAKGRPLHPGDLLQILPGCTRATNDSIENNWLAWLGRKAEGEWVFTAQSILLCTYSTYEEEIEFKTPLLLFRAQAPFGKQSN